MKEGHFMGNSLLCFHGNKYSKWLWLTVNCSNLSVKEDEYRKKIISKIYLIDQVFDHQSLLNVCVRKHSCGNESTKEAKITPPAWGTGELGSPAAPGSASPSSGSSSSCPQTPAQPGLSQPGSPELLHSHSWQGPAAAASSWLNTAATPRISCFPWTQPSWSLLKNNLKQCFHVPFMYKSCSSRI